MANREDLLAGAKRCLIEKGYARTTARDITAASGVSLAAIGYHFGSKDALMNQAVYESIGDWAEELERALGDEDGGNAGTLRRFESIMARTIESFGGENQGLWAAQLEIMSLLMHNDELREFFAGLQLAAAGGLAELFLGIDPHAEPEMAKAVGSVYHCLFIGCIVKWFMNPKQAPSAGELAEGLRIIADRIAREPDSEG